MTNHVHLLMTPLVCIGLQNLYRNALKVKTRLVRWLNIGREYRWTRRDN